jgi:hypothetical protein
MTLTSVTALRPEESHTWYYWDRNLKTLLFAIVVSALMRSPTRVHALIWTVVLLLGYFGVKGGS